MATAMNDAAIAQLMGAVTAQAGEIASVGEARHDDNVSGFRRYRVPVVGAKETVDFQVVIDADMRVAGLGLLPHAPEAEVGAAAPREIEVAVGPANSALPGTLSLPDGDGPFPAVVLVHGSGPNDRDENIMGNRPFRDIAHGLAARGVAVIRYDKRSFTNPQSLMAHGAALTVQHETIDDAVAAVALLRGRAEIDTSRVFVLGHSLGGMVGPRIAAQAKADGMVIMAGAARPLPEMMIEQTDYIVALDDTVTAEEAAQAAKMKEAVASLRAAQRDPASATTPQLGAPVGYYTDLEAHDGPAEAAALDIPILVLQGGRDYQVTKVDFAKWQQALAARPSACLKLYPDLDHLMRTGEGKSGPEDYAVPRLVAPTVIDDIAGFVQDGCKSLKN
jgi:dienelactone hydrolase